MKPKYKVWECKLVGEGDAELPLGFDAALRRAVTAAVEAAGVEVHSCFSGWGAKLTPGQRRCLDWMRKNDTRV